MVTNRRRTSTTEPSVQMAVTPDMEAVRRREAAFDKAIAEVHRESMRATVSEMASALQEVLSTQLTAYMVGVDSLRTIQRWASATAQNLRHKNERRLLTAYEALQLISRFESPRVAKAWFIGLDPQLDYTMPAQAIRDGQLKEVLAAARAFVAGV